MVGVRKHLSTTENKKFRNIFQLQVNVFYVTNISFKHLLNYFQITVVQLL
jgi:hypothetical protein